VQTVDKYRKRVETIRHDSSAHAAAHRMREAAVGCLVVVDDDDRPVGILTDRDLVLRAVAKSGAPARIPAAELMTRDPVTAAPGESLHDVLHRMDARGVRRVPIVDGGRAVGMVSLDDVFQALADDAQGLAAEAPNRYRTAPSASRFEHVRTSVERSLSNLRSRLEYTQWIAREALMDELDDLRRRLKGRDDEEE
jgi:CBS domain-containing protein